MSHWLPTLQCPTCDERFQASLFTDGSDYSNNLQMENTSITWQFPQGAVINTNNVLACIKYLIGVRNFVKSFYEYVLI